jgi:hypothetical protein
MAIFTRYGTRVAIVARHPDFEQSGWVDTRDDTSKKRSTHTSDLKADGGLNEIHTAAMAAPLMTLLEAHARGLLDPR